MILKRVHLWLYSYAWAWFVFFWYSTRRERMSHTNGTTARGRLRITDKPTFPTHDFFQPGREFACRIRHASVAQPDDTVIQVRSASLKFADSPFESPLDLELNTGTISVFWTAHNFMELVTLKNPWVNNLPASHYYDKYPRGLAAIIDGVRKDPTSFTQLYFHSQVPLRFVGRDGVLRYAKYRLVPEDRGPETGLMPEEALRTRYEEKVADGETRSPNYLKNELADRLARGPVTYHLQLQLHTPQPGESEEILNSNIAWDEATHPFHELATVRLEAVLPHEESERTWFSLGNHPPSLGLLPARSIHDYNSLNTMRLASDVARKLRVLICSVVGGRKLLPDDRAALQKR
jgi:arachidonate 5-lipoxygenase